MSNYRKIYKQHYGKIPKDQDGRSYEIHHIDGDHGNDSPDNLKAITIQEHYHIHYTQGDYGACRSIIVRMNKTPEEISAAVSELNKKQVQEGTHVFMRRSDGSSMASDRVANGTHELLGGEIQRKTQNQKVIDGIHNFQFRSDGSSLSADRVANGSHHFSDIEWQKKNAKKLMEEGKHHFLTNNPSNTKVECPYCDKIGAFGPMKRWHFDNCKLNPQKITVNDSKINILEVAPVGVQGLLGPNGVAVRD